MRRVLVVIALLLLGLPVMAGVGHAHGPSSAVVQSHEAAFRPSLAAVWDVVLLQNYNTRLVVLSTALLGLASGLVGSFLLLRKRSLMGDVLSHACLPGIGVLFGIMVLAGGSGKALAGLLLGAVLTGVAGVGVVLMIRNTTRIKDDAAMGIVLSVFFGVGVAILGAVQTLPGASAAGLEGFIYGKTASMVQQDFVLISGVALLASVCSLLFFKEFKVLCFDEHYASSQGWPVHGLDVLMLGLTAAVTVAGLQAVGLILIIAFMITPASAARFWTNRLGWMMFWAASIGAFSGWLGASMSALVPELPAGAVIVLVSAVVFLVSMAFGGARGVVPRIMAQIRLQRKIGRQDVLRAVYELLEQGAESPGQVYNEPVAFDALLQKRSWTSRRLRQLLRLCRHAGVVEGCRSEEVHLSESGYGEAVRITRNHRLWETYLVTHADVATQHIDRDADMVEHVLGAELVRELEREMARRKDIHAVPASIHALHPEGEVA